MKVISYGGGVQSSAMTKPLPQAIAEAQDMLPGFDTSDLGATCDEGYCFT